MQGQLNTPAAASEALFGFPIIPIAHDSREKNLTCMEY